MGLDVYLHVEGVKPPDEKWLQMKNVWDSCQAAGIEPPEEVWKFFEGEDPCEDGVVVKLLDKGVLRSYLDSSEDRSCVVREIDTDHQQGFVIDLEEIPDDIKILRVYNYLSY